MSGPGPILGVAAPANDSGKTTLVCRLLEAFPGRLSAVKAITIYRDLRFCPSDGSGCACHHLESDFRVLVDPATIEEEGTDTGRMVRAGARRVVWGLALEGAHERMWAALVPHLPEAVPVICEGTGVLGPARPTGLVFVFDPSVPRHRWKDPTEETIRRADWVVVNLRGEHRETESGLAWLAERRPSRRLDVDLSVPLRLWSDRRFLAWVEEILSTA